MSTNGIQLRRAERGNAIFRSLADVTRGLAAMRKTIGRHALDAPLNRRDCELGRLCRTRTHHACGRKHLTHEADDGRDVSPRRAGQDRHFGRHADAGGHLLLLERMDGGRFTPPLRYRKGGLRSIRGVNPAKARRRSPGVPTRSVWRWQPARAVDR